MKKNKISGIVLLVLGVLSILGASVNGTFASYAQGLDVSDIVSLVLQVALVVGGIVLIVRKPKTEEE